MVEGHLGVVAEAEMCWYEGTYLVWYEDTNTVV